MYLSVVIPLYNEAGVIETTLHRLSETLMPHFVEHTEVIIVDDCSTDNSAGLAEKIIPEAFETRVIRLTVNSGKGAAVAAGVRAARGDTIVVQDADLELDPSDIPALLEKLHSGDLDLVSGTRFRSGRRYRGHAAMATAVEQDLFICSLMAYRTDNHRYDMRI